MTTENIKRRLSVLERMNRNSRAFRELSSALERIIEAICDFELKDALMNRLTQICCTDN